MAVHGRDVESGRLVPVVVGLVDTEAGAAQIAFRVGDDRVVILELQEANQLALNLNEVAAERLKITAEVLGGEDS